MIVTISLERFQPCPAEPEPPWFELQLDQFLSARRFLASHGSASLRRLLAGVLELRRFEQHRQRREPRIVQQPAERLEPEAALADVLVAIDAAPARLLRVVQVEHLDAVEPDDPIELAKRVVVSRLASRDRSRPSAGDRCRGRRRRAASRRRARGSPPGARTGVRGWCPGRPCARAAPSSSRAAARASSVAIASPMSRRPSSSVPVVYDPGCITRPSRPSDSARSSSSPSAAIDCARSAGAAAARLIR